MESQSIYRRPKFLEVLLEIRQQMARDADYDVDLFAEMIRSGRISKASDGPGSFETAELRRKNDNAAPRGG